MTEARFAKLSARSEFELNCDPAGAIYDDIERQYRMDILALVGEVDDDNWAIPTKVGSLTASLFRFDAALNLGVEPAFVADSHSAIAAFIYGIFENEAENNPLEGGMHRDTVLLHGIELRDEFKGTRVEHEAIRTALMGLSSGVSRAFLQLGQSDMETPAAANKAAIRYAALGFRPVEIGSDLLWLDLEARAFWEG
ncbi:MAG: hypothetical protein R3260_00215 [Pseudomonas sp.]|nr:hypothetical protein [Pseudomonas sp.]